MKNVRVAILGCGGFAGVHAKRMATRRDVQIVALCDVSDAIAKSLCEKHLADYAPAPAVFSDPAEMYAKARPDAVFICTPHTLHARHGLQALDADCHVYMEKPMVTAADDAYAMAAKVDETGKILVIGYNTPCSPEFDFLRQTIREQRLGKLELVIGHLSQNWLRVTAGKWRQQPELSGGGQAYDSGAHLLNSLVWSVESDIAEVFAFIDNCGSLVDINSSINIRFTNGVLASMVVSGNCPTTGSHMSFMFDQGKINIDPWFAHWIEVFQGSERVKYPAITGQAQTPDDNFIEAILGRAEPRTSARNGIVQSELMDAIYESARTGMPARPRSRADAAAGR